MVIGGWCGDRWKCGDRWGGVVIDGWAVVHVLFSQIGQSFLFYVHVCDLNFHSIQYL